jgi:hypothetical protein
LIAKFAKILRLRTSFNKPFLALALSLGFFSWQSCKERTVLPSDLIPAVDNIHTFELTADQLGISLQTGIYDSLKTNDSVNSTIGLGLIPNDPFFGSIKSGLYFQVVPPAAFYTFPDNLVLDSACISLPFDNLSFGDTSNAANNFLYLKVYRLTEPMVKESTYYTFQSFSFNPTPVGGGAVSLQSLTDTFHIPGDTLSGQIRIKLSNAFAQSIIDADSADLVSHAAFISFLNGLYIVPADTTALQNRISYFHLAGATSNAATRIDFFYHNNGDTVSKLVSFPFNAASSAFANRISKNYTGTPANDFIQHTENRDSVLIQGYPGFYTGITIRNLDMIPPSVINKAQLLVTSLAVGSDAIYGPPLRLFLEKLDDNGVPGPIADVLGGSGTPSSGGLDFMDGMPKEITINGQLHYQYALNFPRELQNAIKAGKTELTLRLSSGTTFPGAFRLVADGLHGTNPDTKLKADIIYTKIQ